MKISLTQNPTESQLNELGVFDWPIWTKGISEFPWTYDSEETCFFLEGEVVVQPENGPEVHITSGNLVIFPTGMSCTWKVLQPIKKHYNFS